AGPRGEDRMGEWLSGFLDSGFLPHGHCWYWRPDILWTHVVSDATIAVSYFSIPAALAYFVGRRRDLAYRWIFVLFALFIVACGMTHAMGLLVVWKPYYVLDGAVKAATALISLTTAVVLWPLIPRALALPSPEALRLANEELETARATLERRVEERTSTLAEANARLQREVAERARMEEERRGLEARIQQTQKLESLGVLAGGIAHDFNNLLMGVLGNAGLALMEMSPEAPGRESVRLIETAAQRAAELTNQMLAYSGKGRFVIERLDLSRLVSEMAHLLHVSISKRAALNLRTPAGLPPIEGDAAQIRQVVMNLITNASDALGDGTGTISVTTGRCAADAGYFDRSFIKDDLPEGEYVFVEVSDTGCGMDGETAAKIFDPFFTTKFAGRGLGLAAVLGIVRGHRGAVRVYSEPGRG
ncbi:MAG: hypothetical protein K8I02_03985, partial [Candidatus Methylomirabilis sp.]|nr:hypothetical protein [Deltaproteobacteria bacterium]